VGGSEQTITYGKTPKEFIAILNYEGKPFVRAKVKIAQLYRGKNKETILTTDNFGMVKYTPDAVDVQDDQYGPGKMEVIFEKFNEESKALFTVNLKPRLRVHLEYIFGDNQVTFVGETLANPLIIQAEDEDGHPAPGLRVYWEDLTPGITSSGFGPGAGITETGSDGKSSNTWKMQTKEGSHLAKVTFVHTETDDYIMEAGSKVLFLAEAKLDDLTILRSKTWSLINGPLKNYTTINNPNCSNILTVPSYELQSATLSFQLVNGVTQAVETRGGLCQAQCGNYQLFYGNPCTVVLGSATAENYSNTMQVNGISTSVFQLSNFSPAIPGGVLPWLLYGAKIVSLDSKTLVITSPIGYYTQQWMID